MNDAPPIPVLPPDTVPAEVTLRVALEALRSAPASGLPIRDPYTGETLAVLTRPEPLPPPRLGGMATPLGVYLHDGMSGGGAGPWGLMLAGALLCGLALLAQAILSAVLRFAGLHLPALTHWEASAPLGLREWLASAETWLPLPLVFVFLRLIPLSGTHAAEHQTVHCIERSLPLTVSNIRAMPRVHPRCGTNIFAGWTLFHFVFLAVFCACQSNDFGLSEAVTLALLVAAPPTLIYWRRLGGWVQEHFATRPATDAQIRGAIFAAEQVLSRRQARLFSGTGSLLPPAPRLGDGFCPGAARIRGRDWPADPAVSTLADSFELDGLKHTRRPTFLASLILRFTGSFLKERLGTDRKDPVTEARRNKVVGLT